MRLLERIATNNLWICSLDAAIIPCLDVSTKDLAVLPTVAGPESESTLASCGIVVGRAVEWFFHLTCIWYNHVLFGDCLYIDRLWMYSSYKVYSRSGDHQTWGSTRTRNVPVEISPLKPPIDMWVSAKETRGFIPLRTLARDLLSLECHPHKAGFDSWWIVVQANDIGMMLISNHAKSYLPFLGASVPYVYGNIWRHATLSERNPAPPGIYESLYEVGLTTHELVQNFLPSTVWCVWMCLIPSSRVSGGDRDISAVSGET